MSDYQKSALLKIKMVFDSLERSGRCFVSSLASHIRIVCIRPSLIQLRSRVLADKPKSICCKQGGPARLDIILEKLSLLLQPSFRPFHKRRVRANNSPEARGI